MSRNGQSPTPGDTEFGWQLGVEHRQFFVRDEFEQTVGLFESNHEVHAHGEVAGQFEEMLLVHHAVSTEAGDRAERAATVDAHFFRRFEQPFV